MYAMINRQDMTLACHSKQKPEQMPPLHVLLDLDEASCFKAFTNLEMKILYHNLGQIMGTNLQLRESVEKAVRKLINYRPTQSLDQQQLFTSASASAKPVKSGPKQAGTGRDRQAANTVAPARSGGVRSVIWGHADRVWEAAGKPNDKAVVLQLRKQMMAELEELGVKKTSSSNELGNWMKARIA